MIHEHAVLPASSFSRLYHLADRVVPHKPAKPGTAWTTKNFASTCKKFLLFLTRPYRTQSLALCMFAVEALLVVIGKLLLEPVEKFFQGPLRVLRRQVAVCSASLNELIAAFFFKPLKESRAFHRLRLEGFHPLEVTLHLCHQPRVRRHHILGALVLEKEMSTVPSLSQHGSYILVLGIHVLARDVHFLCSQVGSCNVVEKQLEFSLVAS
mmetsp:Transcript_13/g.33  ORF Transcript_13/g.33 Transcript_13/m.33 type:complete len:210 (-) Transcript_13:552-1181(-)